MGVLLPASPEFPAHFRVFLSRRHALEFPYRDTPSRTPGLAYASHHFVGKLLAEVVNHATHSLGLVQYAIFRPGQFQRETALLAGFHPLTLKGATPETPDLRLQRRSLLWSQNMIHPQHNVRMEMKAGFRASQIGVVVCNLNCPHGKVLAEDLFQPLPVLP